MKTMSSSFMPIFLFFLILILHTFPPASSSSPITTQSSSSSVLPKNCFHMIYAFGDSFTDTGNTNSTPHSFMPVSQFPYGETFFHRPTNRYSDGRLVVDFLAQALGLPFLPPYLKTPNAKFPKGVNFAVAGSTALDRDFYVKNNISTFFVPESLHTQLKWFQSLVRREGITAADNISRVDHALFWVGEIGANDYAFTSLSSSVTPDTVKLHAVANTIGFVQELLKEGAKYMVVQGLPLLGCLPLAQILAPNDDRDEFGCVIRGNRQTDSHNALLQARLDQVRRANPGAIIVYADYAGAHRRVLRNGKRLGFKNLIDACCGAGGAYNFDLTAICGSTSVSLFTSKRASSCSDPATYVNWDGVHFTEAFYRVVSDLFFLGGRTSPPFAELFRRKGCNTH